MEKIIKMSGMLLLQCLVCISILGMYHLKNTPSTDGIIVIDFQKVMKEGLSQIAEHNFDEEKQKKALNQFSIKFRKVMKDLAVETGKTILIKEVVLEGAQDETDRVLAHLFSDKEADYND